MDFWLPLVFAGVMGLALLMYVVLDGYDLGVGILLPLATEDEKDQMLASIGPFWDANETWIVLGVGVLLIAFPQAHGMVLTALYIPATLMLMGLVLRGIAFDFRIKAGSNQKQRWNRIFTIGSLIAAMSQGWMLGAYITGLRGDKLGTLFSLLVSLTLPALYVMLGSAWLQAKAGAALRLKAKVWGQIAWLPMGMAFLLLSIATPLISPAIASKWFDYPQLLMLAPVPLVALLCFALLGKHLFTKGASGWAPFIYLVLLCVLSATGLAYSLYPDIIIGRLDLHQAAAATDSLLFTLWGTLLTVPFIIGYTIFVYRIFSGELSQQHYE